MKHNISYSTLSRLAADMAKRIKASDLPPELVWPLRVYPVPRGGIPAALALAEHLSVELVHSVHNADVVVDDLIDSGATAKRYSGGDGLPFYALLDKREPGWAGKWVVFPWEQTAEGGVEDNVRRLIQYVGDDPAREGLAETPARVAKAWAEWCSGYGQDPAEVLKAFEDGAADYDEMVVVRDIPVYSTCEHHMAAIFGTATVAYVPDGRVVGLSKLSRLVDVFARRLQVQERLTTQVADALMANLAPKGCGVVIKARHMCMESRGVRQAGHHTVTSALRGVFRDQPATRAEFLALARG